jgi:hypothetical protein
MYRLKVFKYKERHLLGFLTMFLSFLIPFSIWIVFDRYSLDFVFLGIIWILLLFSLPVLIARFRFINLGTLYFDNTTIKITARKLNISLPFEKINKIEFYYQTDHYWFRSFDLFPGFFRYHSIRKNYKGSKLDFERIVIDEHEYFLKIRNKKEFYYLLNLKDLIIKKTKHYKIFSKSFDNDEFIEEHNSS